MYRNFFRVVSFEEKLTKAHCSLVCPTQTKDQHGCTPLHEAATYNQIQVAEMLIKHEANIRILDSDKCTPLHLAAMEGLIDMCKLLIDKCEPSVLKQVRLCMIATTGYMTRTLRKPSLP